MKLIGFFLCFDNMPSFSIVFPGWPNDTDKSVDKGICPFSCGFLLYHFKMIDTRCLFLILAD